MDTSIVNAFRVGLAPIRKVSANIWADNNIVLSSESSAEAGPWRTSRTPYLKEILECLSPTNPAQRIVFAKGVQVGATASGLICMLSYVDTDPSPIMYVMPTIGNAEDFSKDRLQPMVNNCESLKGKIKDSRTRDSGNTTLGKRYPGGFIALAGANSATSLRSKAIRVLILDEVDAYPRNLDNEGSPVALAEKRTITFTYRKKVYLLSTPTVLGSSVITAEYELTDQRKYHVACPHCGCTQQLKFTNLKWTEGNPNGVKYQCAECFDLIDERHKNRMLAAGSWVSEVPERRNNLIVGFHLNTLYSPWYSWDNIAAEYEKAIISQRKDKDDNLLRAFTNTILGEPYAEGGEAPDWEKLYGRRADYKRNKPNNNVLIITAGMDVQKDRVEIEIVGWGLDKRSWSLDYRVITGDISDVSVQTEIKKVFDEIWIREDNLQMPIHKVCVDSSDNTTEVYAFCNTCDHEQVLPIKGMDSQNFIFSAPVPVNRTPAGEKFGTLKRFNIGVTILKKELYKFLKKSKSHDDELGPPGYCHFPQYDEIFFKGLTAEEEQTVYERGYPKRKWTKIFQRNEPLDCFDGETEVLTYDGWRKFTEIDKSFELATVNLEKDIIEYQKPTDIISRMHEGKMIELKGFRLDILTTPGHRMITYKKEKIYGEKWNFNVDPKITLAKDLTIHHQIKCASNWIGNSVNEIAIPESNKSDGTMRISDELYIDSVNMAAFLGWYVSDGHKQKKFSETQNGFRYSVCITQNEGEKLNMIKSVLDKLPWKYSIQNTKGEGCISKRVHISSKQLYEFVLDCGENTYNKCVPQWIKDSNPEVIQSFVTAAILGDGWVQKKKENHKDFRTYSTVSRKLADDMQELFLKLGKASNIKIKPAADYNINGRTGSNTVDQYHVTELNKIKASLDTTINGGRSFLGKEVDFSGMVYCATVPNGTLILRRNGRAFIAGNCRNYARAAASISGMDAYENDALIKINQSYVPKGDDKKKKRISTYW